MTVAFAAGGLAVRRAVASSDADACAALYAPYVLRTAITFEIDPPDGSVMAQRIVAAQRRHDWLVLVDAETVIGYAYAGPYKDRPAYRWACEVSVYLEWGRRRTGAGRMLYADLFARLAARGYRTAVAGMTLPNPASEGLHAALGFQPVGVHRAIGYKHGAWHDVAWAQRELRDLTTDWSDPVDPH